MNTDSKLAATAMKKRSKITEKAIQSFQEELDQRQNEEIKEVFNLFDVERKGVINGHNMKICFKTLGIEMKQKEIEDLLKQTYNKDVSQTFKFEEFFQLVKKKLKEKNADVEYGEQFKLLCDYKPGDERDLTKITINKEYLTELAKNVGEIMSSEEIDEMISIVGGEDGTININQFIEFMKNPIEYKSNNNI
jgi:Ca2+-binding EF-hand superfamily protein